VSQPLAGFIQRLAPSAVSGSSSTGEWGGAENRIGHHLNRRITAGELTSIELI
jgi:hypothetical protein